MSAVVESIMGENAKPAGPAGSHPPAAVNSQAPASPPAAIPARRAKKRLASGGLFMRVAPPLLGLALLVLVWQIIALKTSSFPTPWVTLKEAGVMFADPFYRNSPNDQGIGWNVLASLQRVGTGFGLAALVGIPLGFAIDRKSVV